MKRENAFEPQPPWGSFSPSAIAGAVIAVSRNSILGRGIARKMLAAEFGRLHTGPVDVDLWGTHVRLHPDNNVVERKAMLRPDQFDIQERTLLRQVMSQQGTVFVDVGGNAGLYSLDAALHAGDSATILMVEPDARLIERFVFNLEEGRRSGHIKQSLTVHAVSVAISDCEGTGVLCATGDEGSRNIIDNNSNSGLQVPLRTLQSVVGDAGIDHIDIMKIDVEGFEDKVLPPYLRSATKNLLPRYIIIEHLQRSRWQPDCISDAAAWGYRIAGTTRNNTFLRLV